MNFIRTLSAIKGLLIRCPECSSEFPVSHASLFDATRRFPDDIEKRVKDKRRHLKEERVVLFLRKKTAIEKSKKGAHSIRIGKVVEKIAPSLRDFPVTVNDCRALFEPIDFIVFNGLSRQGKIESISFVDIKSGGAKLSREQKNIKSAVEAGNVSLVISPDFLGGKGLTC